MGVRVLWDAKEENACLYCSTTMWAFGPLMQSEEEALSFLEWLPKDARVYPDDELLDLYHKFCNLTHKEEVER